MRRTVFLDTSYLLAIIRKRDSLHAVALIASVNYSGPFVTTDLVLVELANSLSQPPYRSHAASVIDKIRADRNNRARLAIKEGKASPMDISQL